MTGDIYTNGRGLVRSEAGEDTNCVIWPRQFVIERAVAGYASTSTCTIQAHRHSSVRIIIAGGICLLALDRAYKREDVSNPNAWRINPTTAKAMVREESFPSTVMF